MSQREFFVDYSRCIGCQACVQACAECDTHRGTSMIHLETIDRLDSVQTAPEGVFMMMPISIAIFSSGCMGPSTACATDAVWPV